MTDAPAISPLENFLSRLNKPKRTRPGQWEARCPAHDDQHASLGISTGDDGRVLVKCLAGCSTQLIVKAVGLTFSDLFTEEQRKQRSKRAASIADRRGKIVAEYDYLNANGELVYQVVRFEPKDFRQRRPDGSGGWLWNVQKSQRILYRLPELLAAPAGDWVFIVEGEKDVDELRRHGMIATCNPGGAMKWDGLSDDSALNGRRIAILMDKDGPGRSHGADVAYRLANRARDIRVFELPGEHKDAFDWFTANGTVDGLLDLVRAAPRYRRTEAFDPIADHELGFKLGVKDEDSERVVISLKKTLPTAKAFVREKFSHPDGRTVHFFAKAWYSWNLGKYSEVEEEHMRSEIGDWLQFNMRPVPIKGTDESKLVDFHSNRNTKNDAIDALRSYAYLKLGSNSFTRWLTDRYTFPIADVLPCRSAILHLPTMQRIPATPALFTTTALEFDHDPQAPEPETWLKFLKELFGDDIQSWELLQEWFGYCLTPDTSQQKILLIIGPKRAGKGTIARVLRRLVGDGNVAGPTTTSLAGDFGLQPLIDKSLAIVSDARFSGNDVQTVIERLLCISGEDAITVDRKSITSVTLKLPTRFVLLTNPIPKLPDSAGAITGRLLVMRLTESFFGREDTELEAKLYRELPGILNWSIDGWRRLRERGRFVQPESAGDVIDDLESLSSPVSAFVRDCCQIGQDHQIWVDDLYAAWVKWCDREGRDHPSSKAWFGRDLKAACPGVRAYKASNDMRAYHGIDLKQGSIL